MHDDLAVGVRNNAGANRDGARPDLRLDRESFGTLGLDLKSFQGPDGLRKALQLAVPEIVQALGEFIDEDAAKSDGGARQHLSGKLRTVLDVFEIVRAASGRSAMPADLLSTAHQVERFKVALDIIAQHGADRIGFQDWLDVKREAVDLKYFLIEFQGPLRAAR